MAAHGLSLVVASGDLLVVLPGASHYSSFSCWGA